MQNLFIESLGLVTANDTIKLMLGRQLGAGVFRTVFEFAQKPTQVLKVETRATFANPQEWEVWQRVQNTDWAKWFAPCVAISDTGAVLIQQRTEPVTLKELEKALPRVPVFFTDLKVGNWGKYEGRIVCHDYANHCLYERGLSKATKVAEWWDSVMPEEPAPAVYEEKPRTK